MARNITKTAQFGFEVDTWEVFSDGMDHRRPGDLSPRQCERPECGAVFTPAKSWARYCSKACRYAEAHERRAVGELIARPLLIAREGKHAKPGTRAAHLATTARRYVDMVATRWREGRERRRVDAAQGREAA